MWVSELFFSKRELTNEQKHENREIFMSRWEIKKSAGDVSNIKDKYSESEEGRSIDKYIARLTAVN